MLQAVIEYLLHARAKEVPLRYGQIGSAIVKTIRAALRQPKRSVPGTNHYTLAGLELHLRVYSTVGQVAEAGGGGRLIDWGSAATYRAGVKDADTIELCYTGNHFDLIWRGLNPPAAEPLRE